MNLSELRTWIVDKSGRLDLSDAQLNDLINRSCRLLDTITVHNRKESFWYANTEVGKFYIELPESHRYITDLSLSAEDSFIPLEQIDPAALLNQFLVSPSIGTPEHYAVLNPKIAELTVDQLSHFSDLGVLSHASSVSNLYIIFSARFDAIKTIRVKGFFGTLPLLLDTDYNKWTVYYSDLVYSAFLHLSIKDLGNAAEAAKLLVSVNSEASFLLHDDIESEQISQMEG